jgi:hypothetical protein
MELMANNTFCTGLFPIHQAALMRDRSRMLPIFLQEVFAVSVVMIHLNMSKLAVVFTDGDTVPIFNGSPPL